MRSRIIAAAAFALLAITFAVDALTPQTLVVAILLDVPIVLAAITRSRRLTATLVIGAVTADVTAAFLNSARDGWRWEPIGIGDRALSLVSIVLVGFLSTAVQERAERVGRLAAQEARARREAALGAAADRMRTSFSPSLVLRAIVREASTLLAATSTYWYPATAGEVLARRDGSVEVEVLDERPVPEIATLTQRVAADEFVAVVRGVDPVGRLVLDRIGGRSALAIPLADRAQRYGTLLAALPNDDPGETELTTARDLRTVAVEALAHARLFDELAERNEALAERQTVIRELVYALSHDVRTPLAALSMTLRQALDGAYGPLPERYTAVVRDSLGSIDDLQQLAETLLLVARFESGERRAERNAVDLAALAGEIGSELGAIAERRRIGLAVTAPRPATTLGSRGDLRRAVANLVSNALRHTPEGGTVELRVAPRGGGIEVVVADDGFGVDPALRDALFRRFSGGAGGGTGLGLYIVRRIAEESGGTVRYEPREPRGSVFILSLPKASG